MGSPEKPVDVEMGDMSESAHLNPDPEKPTEDKNEKSARFTGLTKEELLGKCDILLETTVQSGLGHRGGGV